MGEYFDIGGPVDSEVSYLRDDDCVVRYDVIGGVLCRRCDSGEVIHPPQTMEMPVLYSCLMCGKTAPRGDFKRL